MGVFLRMRLLIMHRAGGGGSGGSGRGGSSGGGGGSGIAGVLLLAFKSGTVRLGQFDHYFRVSSVELIL